MRAISRTDASDGKGKKKYTFTLVVVVFFWQVATVTELMLAEYV